VLIPYGDAASATPLVPATAVNPLIVTVPLVQYAVLPLVLSFTVAPLTVGPVKSKAIAVAATDFVTPSVSFAHTYRILLPSPSPLMLNVAADNDVAQLVGAVPLLVLIPYGDAASATPLAPAPAVNPLIVTVPLVQYAVLPLVLSFTVAPLTLGPVISNTIAVAATELVTPATSFAQRYKTLLPSPSPLMLNVASDNEVAQLVGAVPLLVLIPYGDAASATPLAPAPAVNPAIVTVPLVQYAVLPLVLSFTVAPLTLGPVRSNTMAGAVIELATPATSFAQRYKTLLPSPSPLMLKVAADNEVAQLVGAVPLLVLIPYDDAASATPLAPATAVNPLIVTVPLVQYAVLPLVLSFTVAPLTLGPVKSNMIAIAATELVTPYASFAHTYRILLPSLSPFILSVAADSEAAQLVGAVPLLVLIPYGDAASATPLAPATAVNPLIVTVPLVQYVVLPLVLSFTVAPLTLGPVRSTVTPPVTVVVPGDPVAMVVLRPALFVTVTL
jgi:hypothetical protein